MGKRVDIAYEPDHECKEGCGCDTGYVDAVRDALADLGSSDPEGDIAKHSRYLRGARKAGLEPVNAAAMILAMSQKDPGVYTPRYRYEDASEPAAAYEYVAVDTQGRKVAGPTKDYQEAKREADKVSGYVKFYVAEAGEVGEPRKRDAGAFTWDDAGIGSGPGVGRWIGTSPRAPQHVYEIHHEPNDRWSLWRWNRYHTGGWSPEKTPMERLGEYGTMHEAKRAAAVYAGAIAGEPGAAAYDFDSYIDALRAAKKKGWSYVSLDAPNKRAMLYTEPTGNTTKDRVLAVEMFEKDGRWHIGGASQQTSMDGVPSDAYRIDEIIEGKTAKASEARDKFERCVRHVKAEGHAVNPWAVCRAQLSREPEPFTRKHVPWHRDGAGYYADVEPYGRIRVKNRTQDKRAGKLAWYAVVQKIEVAQAESRGEVSSMVEEHLRNPVIESAAGEDCVRIVPRGDVDVVERDPKCAPSGVDISTPKRLHGAMRDLVARSGKERFWAIGQSKQGEMVGQPVEIAIGQVDRVAVDVADFVGTAAKLRQAGAVSVYAVHCHPSNHGDRPSEKDRELTKLLKKGMDAIEMPFAGHYSMGRDGWAKA